MLLVPETWSQVFQGKLRGGQASLQRSFLPSLPLILWQRSFFPSLPSILWDAMGRIWAVAGLLCLACHGALGAPHLQRQSVLAPALLWSIGGQYFAHEEGQQGDRVAYAVSTCDCFTP